MPHILHFMSRLRKLCNSATKRRSVKLSLVHKEDLVLLQNFIYKSHQGIDINLITIRQPTHAYFSDACPARLGGYNDRGTAWRWPIPHRLQCRASINMLEHVASTIGLWMDILVGNLPPLSCSILLSDNTTSAGWLGKSNFVDQGDGRAHSLAKLQVAWAHAARFMEKNIHEYSQWFPGKDNIIADALSRDFHLSDNQLTQLIRSHLPPQPCQLFTIVPMPPKIACWLCAWLQQLPENHQRQEVHQPSNLQLGNDGTHFFSQLIFPTTLTSKPSNSQKGSSSYPPLLKPSDQQNSLSPQLINWVRTQSAMPSTMWLRPSGTDNIRTPGSTQMANLHDFHQRNTKDTATRIPIPNNKKHFQPRSFSNCTGTNLPSEVEP